MKIPSFSLSAKTKKSLKKGLLYFFALFGVLSSVTIALFIWGFHLWLAEPTPEEKTPDAMILTLDFTQPIVERPSGFSLSLPALLREGRETPLFTIVRALERAGKDSKVKAVVARFDSVSSPSLAQAQEIAEALRRFRESEKPSYSFASSYGDFSNGRALFVLASGFEHIWLQPVGTLGLTGFGMETPFAKSALEKIGVRANFLRREEYKSVMENVSRDSYSPTVRTNMESMLRDMHNQVTDEIARNRKLEGAAAKTILAKGPYTGAEALKAGLVTKIAYEDELQKEVEDKFGKDCAAVDPQTYLYYANKDAEDKAKADIALIYAEGVLTDQPKRGPYKFAGDETIDTDELVEAFTDARENEKIKAILFRIDSPGGSPVASESIRRALIKAKESKIPVFVSMGAVAASGGYWIAMDADHIVADPATLTGSIGVVGGKFVLGGLFDKIGLKWDRLEMTDNASLFSPREPFDAKGEERVNAMLDDVYQAFLKNVSSARKIPMEKMKDVAKGRVFTGRQALDVKLVDELGGMSTSLAAIKKHLRLAPEDKVAVWLYPAQETPQSIMLRMLKNMNLGTLFENFGSFVNASALLNEAARRLGPLWNELESAENGAIRAVLPAPFPKKGW